MEPNVKFLIRGQAQNGMFLGPDSYNGAVITITNLSDGTVLAQGLLNTGDSGTRSTPQPPPAQPAPPNSSSYTIFTPGNPDPTYYVVAADTTVAFTGAFYIASPTQIEVHASQPLGPGHPNAEASVKLNVSPGDDLSQGVGIVVPVQGLWVQPEILRLGQQLRVRAKVTMMCGCEINANSPWLPTDFVVTATLTPTGPEAIVLGPQAMTFQINSQFYTNFDLPDVGNYTLVLHAKQLSSGLEGSASAAI